MSIIIRKIPLCWQERYWQNILPNYFLIRKLPSSCKYITTSRSTCRSQGKMQERFQLQINPYIHLEMHAFVFSMCVPKSSSLKMYLRSEKWTMNETLIFYKIRAVLKKFRDWSCIYQERKWTMNETLIFFKIRAVLKKYRDWSCIYQERNEQWMKRWFSSKYELCCKKSIETEAVFMKINNEWKVDFPLNVKYVFKNIETEAVFTKKIQINRKCTKQIKDKCIKTQIIVSDRTVKRK